MINKTKNLVQDIPIKSFRNILKNSTKYYINIITKRQLVYRQRMSDTPCEKAGNL